MTAALDLRGLSYTFGKFRAVDDLTFAVEPGECFGLLGPNGAGKTTTIRLLNTLLPLQQGDVWVFGRAVRKDAMGVRRLIGYVPQSLSIEGDLTGRQNVEWFARLFDVPRRERRGRVDEVLEMVDLRPDENRLASTYSGGMVRRLELAQALVNRPALLVLDEPTVGLDPVARDSVWHRVAQMQRDHGMTVLLTTHYMEEADALCDRIALMHHGRLRALGSPDDLKSDVGADASLEDVFRHHTGENLETLDGVATEKGGLRSVRATRRTARRLD